MSAAAVAQTSAPAPAAGTQAAPSADAPAGGAYATGQPLQQPSKEGFWGRVNPFARKKWVAREVDPVRERVNELDQLQAKNATDIKDVDSRAQAGISKAMMAANTADQHAADAANRAGAAQSTADSATSKTQTLNGTVSSLDQYSQVVATDVPFANGRTTLGPQGKAALDDMATKVAGEKGYIIEVQGFSKGGVQTSQAMADAVVRYLVSEHQVPVYRIYRTGLGKQTAEGDDALVNGVHVSLLHNSLATMAGNSTTASSATSPAPAAGVN